MNRWKYTVVVLIPVHLLALPVLVRYEPEPGIIMPLYILSGLLWVLMSLLALPLSRYGFAFAELLLAFLFLYYSQSSPTLVFLGLFWFGEALRHGLPGAALVARHPLEASGPPPGESG